MVVLGTVIATRRLELPGSRTLTLRIGMPRPSSDVDWCCPYELVEEPGGRLVEALEVFGIDALQALQLAMKGADAALERIGNVRWPAEPGDGSPTKDG